MLKPLLRKTHLFSGLFFLSALISCSHDDDPVTTKPDPDPVKPDPVVTVTEYPVQNPFVIPKEVQYLYDNENLSNITLEVTTEEWNKLLSYYDQNPNNEEYVAATFSYTKGGSAENLTNTVGLRIRGNTSRRRPEGTTGQTHSATAPDWHHASFTLNFKKFDKKQTFHEAEKVNLKWFKDDANYVREVYCYDLFERFGVWTAPQSGYTTLTIKIKEDNKPAYFGVYQIIEPVDELYLKNRKTKFTTTTGNLWKGNYGASLKYADRSKMDVENVTLTSNYTPVYDLKTNKKSLESAKDQLSDFITQLNSKSGDDLKAYLSQKMDVDLFVRTYAVNVMCGMWDDYWRNTNNFYFYFDAEGKFYFIPYDYDNSLGTSLLVNDSGKQDVLNWGDPSNPLVLKVLSIPEYKALYIKYLNELKDPKYNLFYVKNSQNRITKWQDLIRNRVANDTDEDMYIGDAPAYWGNCSFYNLHGSNALTNYFIVRAANIPAQ